MSILNSKKVTGSILGDSKKSGSLKREKVVNFDYIFNGNVPAGRYHSTVKKVKEVTTKKGFPALEVCYELKPLGSESSQTYNVKQVYPEGTKHYDNFVDAMAETINASADQEISFKDLLGVTEEVVVDYPDDGEWGTFTSRKPLKKSTDEDVKENKSLNKNQQMHALLADDEDEEDDDDFLLDDDD